LAREPYRFGDKSGTETRKSQMSRFDYDALTADHGPFGSYARLIIRNSGEDVRKESD